MSEFVYHPSFGGKHAEQRIMRDPAPVPRANIRWYFSDAPTTEDSSQLLTTEQERVLFLQFNYCRWRAHRDGGEWVGQAARLKEVLTEYNLALVISMVSKFCNVGSPDYDDLVCEGNLSLLRSVELFDIGKGYKFSTYACHSICNIIFRRWRKKARELPTVPDPDLGSGGQTNTDLLELGQVLFDAPLDDKERAVIQMRYLDDEPLILEEIGRRLKPAVSKERVRQIEAKALDKLRNEWYSVRTTDSWRNE